LRIDIKPVCNLCTKELVNGNLPFYVWILYF